MWSRPSTAAAFHPSTSRPATTRPSTGRRPWTAQSRPATGRPQTAVSARHEGSYVVALLEARGVGREIGIAALDKETGRVMIVQVQWFPFQSSRNLNAVIAF